MSKESLVNSLSQTDYSKKVFFETMINILIRDFVGQIKDTSSYNKPFSSQGYQRDNKKNNTYLSPKSRNVYMGGGPSDNSINFAKHLYVPQKTFSKGFKSTYHDENSNKSGSNYIYLTNSFNDTGNKNIKRLSVASSSKPSLKIPVYRTSQNKLKSQKTGNPFTNVNSGLGVLNSKNLLVQSGQNFSKNKSMLPGLHQARVGNSLEKAGKTQTHNNKNKISLVKYNEDKNGPIKKNNLADIKRLTRPTVSSQHKKANKNAI